MQLKADCFRTMLLIVEFKGFYRLSILVYESPVFRDAVTLPTTQYSLCDVQLFVSSLFCEIETCCFFYVTHTGWSWRVGT
jgi:hypothetical protein